MEKSGSYERIGFFLAWTFGLSWGPWLISFLLTKNGLSQAGRLFFLLVVILGPISPCIASLVTKRRYGNKEEFHNFLKTVLKVKVSIGWYLFIFALPFLLWALPWFIKALVYGTSTPLFTSPLLNFFWLLPFALYDGGLEEVGWRGVLLPEFLKTQNSLGASLIVGLIWSFWHLPHWISGGPWQPGWNFLQFTLTAVGGSLLFTVLYLGSGSLLLCILMHAFYNAADNIISGGLDLTHDSLIKLSVCTLVFILFGRTRRDRQLKAVEKETGGRTLLKN